MNNLEKELKSIKDKLNSIYEEISSKSNNVDDYISEHEAKKLLKKGTTWFWKLRQNGFPYSKLGNEVFYLKRDFATYLANNEVNPSKRRL